MFGFVGGFGVIDDFLRVRDFLVDHLNRLECIYLVFESSEDFGSEGFDRWRDEAKYSMGVVTTRIDLWVFRVLSWQIF